MVTSSITNAFMLEDLNLEVYQAGTLLLALNKPPLTLEAVEV